MACKSSKVQTQLPFKLFNAFYYQWVGGQPGIKGTNVVIKGLNTNLSNFTADSIYFDNKVVKAETHIKNDTLVLMGYFTSYPKPVVLELESSQKNQNISLNPYQLKANEAVLTYFFNGKKQSFKFLNLIKTENKYYP